MEGFQGVDGISFQYFHVSAEGCELSVHRFKRLRDKVPMTSAIMGVSQELGLHDVEQQQRLIIFDSRSKWRVVSQAKIAFEPDDVHEDICRAASSGLTSSV